MTSVRRRPFNRPIELPGRLGQDLHHILVERRVGGLEFLDVPVDVAADAQLDRAVIAKIPATERDAHNVAREEKDPAHAGCDKRRSIAVIDGVTQNFHDGFVHGATCAVPPDISAHARPHSRWPNVILVTRIILASNSQQPLRAIAIFAARVSCNKICLLTLTLTPRWLEDNSEASVSN